jgi:uncharacterized protein (UPF0276 family)
MAIQIGITDSPLTSSLINQAVLEVDYLEVHGPYAENARVKFPGIPMLLHNSLYSWSMAHPDGVAFNNYANVTRQRMILTRAPWYSLHLGFSAVDVTFDNWAFATSPVLPAEILLERYCQVLNQLGEQLDTPILVENLDYNPTGAYEHICDSQFIGEVVRATSCGLLLDTAHAQVSAAAFGVPVRDYIRALPLEKVRQIHVNRPEMKDGRLSDLHEALQEENFELLSFVLGFCEPWSITLEYNRDADQLLRQVERLRKIVQ